MKTVTEVQPNVTLIELDGRQIYLVGTAHVSMASADLVEEVISREGPDAVCVELCPPRLESLEHPERWSNTDIFQVVKTGKSYVLLAQLLLSSFQKRLGKKLGVQAGEEMRRALTVARREGVPVAVVDREIRITLKRAWSKAGIWSMAKIIAGLLTSVFSDEEISETEIERLKGSDALSALMSEFSGILPGVKEVLIDERDCYMTAKIAATSGNKIVAVVGAGHVPGMCQAFGTDIDIAALEEIPSPSNWLKLITWGLPLAILLMIVYGFFTMGTDVSMQMVTTWVLTTGVLAALGALIALSHPLTILTAFLAAPITTLHPAIAAGWVCGLVEAMLRKPRVRDLETIADDVSTIRGVWTNRVSKVLLVVFFSNLGSAIGAMVGSVKLAMLLK